MKSHIYSFKNIKIPKKIHVHMYNILVALLSENEINPNGIAAAFQFSGASSPSERMSRPKLFK